MLTVWVILSLVTFRVTRFFLEDSLIEEPRNKLYTWLLGGRPYHPGFDYGAPPYETKGWRLKLLELLTCPYCFSVWVSAGAVGLSCWWWSVPQPFWMWLAVATGSLMAWHYIED